MSWRRALVAPRQPAFWLVLLVVASLLARAIAYNADAPLWDAGAFVSMGKYLWSGGESGLYEPMRPPLWPLLLGALWKLGADPLRAGDWAQIACSGASIALLYLLGRRFGRWCGLLAATLFALSPTTFYWGNELYTAIPGTCLLLAGCLAAQRGWPLLAGCLLALTTLTRFELALAVLPCALLVGLPFCGARSRLLRFAVGLASFGLPWLFANALAFGDPLAPLRQGLDVFGAYASLWRQSPGFYLRFLLQHEHWLLSLSPLALVVCLRRKDAGALALMSVGFLLLGFFSLQTVQTIRYVVPALPFLYLAASVGMLWLWSQLSRTIRLRATLVAALLLAQWPQLGHFRQQDFTPRQPDVFQRAAVDYERRGGRAVWISNPTMLVYTDLRAEQLMYYPIFDVARASELRRNLARATLYFPFHHNVLLVAADLPCSPVGDAACLLERDALLAELSSLRPLWQALDAKGALQAGIYLRAP